MKFGITTVAILAAAQASGVSATWWGWGSNGSTWGQTISCILPWNYGSSSCNNHSPSPPSPPSPPKPPSPPPPSPPKPPSPPSPPKWQWPPAPPKGCPPGYPYPPNPWPQPQWPHPGTCPKPPKMTGPKYPPGCTPNPPKNTNFTLACPWKPAGQIGDGQIQCNSPYPGQEKAAGSISFISSTFYIQDGGLYDQLGRGCEISSGNQLQCNVLPVGSTAQKGFAIDKDSNLIWQGENTWYGCNIGTDDSFGQIIFTGTHKDFSGPSSDTDNPNCDAYRLGVVFVK